MSDKWSLSGAGPESYEQFQVPAVFEPLASLLLDLVRLQPGQSVLDVACGTGIVARKAAAIVGPSGRIVAVDFNDAMLEVAKRNTPSDSPNIEWRQSDANNLPLSDASVDVAICQQGLQFFPDKTGALREMYRVLRSGGYAWLAVWRSPEHSPINRASNDILERHLGPEAAKTSRAPFSLGNAEELKSLMSAAEFRDIDIRTATITRYMAPPGVSIPAHLMSTPLGPQIAALSESERLAIVAEFSKALADYVTEDGLSVPQGTHIISGRK